MVIKVNPVLEQAAQALGRRKFNVKLADTAQDAKRILLELIPTDAVVGVGDSATVFQTGVLAELESRGNKVFNPFKPEVMADKELMKQTEMVAGRSDVFITGSNTLTLDGRLVNTDMVGNRVGGMFFGVPRVVLVVGRNKIVADVDAARARLRDLIAPYHAAGKRLKTPCAKTGKCTDCDSPDRICNVTVILEHKPLQTDITVILVNEDMGLSWDPSWSKERIDSIKDWYHRVTI